MVILVLLKRHEMSFVLKFGSGSELAPYPGLQKEEEDIFCWQEWKKENIAAETNGYDYGNYHHDLVGHHEVKKGG